MSGPRQAHAPPRGHRHGRRLRRRPLGVLRRRRELGCDFVELFSNSVFCLAQCDTSPTFYYMANQIVLEQLFAAFIISPRVEPNHKMWIGEPEQDTGSVSKEPQKVSLV